MNTALNKPVNRRLQALDVMRGITIAGMILVNNPGSWGSIYAPLKHASWNGLTPTDLVFPFFMFIMGISCYISLRKYGFEFTGPAALKIIRRTFVIFAVGLGLNWLSLSCSTGEFFPFDRIRIPGVLQRLALSYGFAALIVLLMKHKYIPYLIVALLVGYFFVLLFGNGFEYDETNLLGIIDRAMLGNGHILSDHGIDPEGVLSTIPSIAHVLIGFCCGKLLVEEKNIDSKIQKLFLIGAALTFAGFLLAYACPINKKIWSPTYVMVTCGLASTLLALLIWLIDVKGCKKAGCFFETFGVNPLFIYVTAGITAVLLGNIPLFHGEETTSLSGYVYHVVLRSWLGNYPASLAYALLFVTLHWLIGLVLYRKKIYIKI